MSKEKEKANEEDYQDWHRMFGLGWKDRMTGEPVRVEAEYDVSVKQQLLDVLVVLTKDQMPSCELPDGFENLGLVNALSFKSFWEPFDGESLEEGIHHGVALRKIFSDEETQEALPVCDVRLFGISARKPQKLFSGLPQGLRPINVSPGVYDIPRHIPGQYFRMIAISELEAKPNNALLLLFSAEEELVRYAIDHFKIRSQQTSTFIFRLLDRYRKDGIKMSSVLEKFAEDIREEQIQTLGPEYLKRLSPEKLLEGVPVEKRLESVPVEKRLEGVPVEKRLESVPVEKRLESVPVEKRLEGMTADDLLKNLSPETLAALAKRIRENGSSGS